MFRFRAPNQLLAIPGRTSTAAHSDIGIEGYWQGSVSCQAWQHGSKGWRVRTRTASHCDPECDQRKNREMTSMRDGGGENEAKARRESLSTSTYWILFSGIKRALPCQNRCALFMLSKQAPDTEKQK